MLHLERTSYPNAAQTCIGAGLYPPKKAKGQIIYEQHVNKNRRGVSACTRHRVSPHGGGKQCAAQVTARVLEGKNRAHSWVTFALQIVVISVTIMEEMNSQHAPRQKSAFFSSLFALEVIASSGEGRQ